MRERQSEGNYVEFLFKTWVSVCQIKLTFFLSIKIIFLFFTAIASKKKQTPHTIGIKCRLRVPTTPKADNE